MLAITVLVCAVPVAEAEDNPNTVARCIKVAPEARYRGLGYNHIVHVADTCKVGAECDVSTDVNPQPTHITLGGGENTEVTTFMGSPARVFTPKGDCVMKTQ